MGMVMGMGHWVLWAVAGLIAIFALVSMIGWMRREKQQGITNLEEEEQTLDEIISGSGSTTTHTVQSNAADEATYDATKHKGWGFWPWALISLLVLGGLAWVIWNSSMAPGAGAFQWILWALLPMAGVISLLGLAQMNRRHPLVDEKKGSPRGLGFLTLLSGLVLGLASWFIWQPQTAGLSSLQNNITELKAENDGLASKLTSRNTIIERLNGDAKKGALRYADLEKDMGANDASNQGELSRLKGVISGLRGRVSSSSANGDEIAKLNAQIGALSSEKENLTTENNRMNGLVGTYKNDSEVQGAKIAALNAEIETLRNKPAPTPAEPTTRSIVKKRTTPLAMMHRYNQDETKLRLTSGDYNMVKMGNNELVNGKRGRYYTIALRNPADGKAYKFASASYSKIANDQQFKQSLDRVISDIRGAFDGKRHYQIYVQGKASAGRYNGKMADGFDYSNMTVMENKGGSYGPSTIGRQYGPKIGNDDLPNLRGAFLQEYVGKNYKVTMPVILDGKVSKSKKANKQAVALILYVED